MGLFFALGSDGSSATPRLLQPGDIRAGNINLSKTLTTVGAGTILAAVLASGAVTRTGPTAGYTDTTDTATNIINALMPNVFIGSGAVPGGAGSSGGIQPGTNFPFIFINTVAFAMTLAAGTGVTLGSNVNCAASSVKDYIVTITNGTPQQVFAATVDGSTAVITGMTQAQTNQLSVGMAVTGTGIAASSNIISIQPGVGVTLNNNTTSAGTNVALTFSPTITINSIGQKLL